MQALVYARTERNAAELVNKAGDLADSVAAADLGGAIEDPEALADRGADEVVVVDDPALEDPTVDVYADALAAVAEDVDPDLVLVGGSRFGKEVAPHAAVDLDAACMTLIQDVREGDDGLEFDRSFLGGKTVATEVATTTPIIATVPPRTFEAAPEGSGGGDVRTLDVDVGDSEIDLLGVKESEEEGVNLEDAPVIVSCGRGFDSEDDLQLAFDLAGTVGGEVGCSRPLATDLGWLTDEHWIGLSGKDVKPDLYIAVGISGQIQHTTGIRGSESIVAVNTDENAPIFEVSDFGIVGDLYDVLPALNKALASELGS
jgi:electron transfer flavoprotein alpha subunit